MFGRKRNNKVYDLPELEVRAKRLPRTRRGSGSKRVRTFSKAPQYKSKKKSGGFFSMFSGGKRD